MEFFIKSIIVLCIMMIVLSLVAGVQNAMDLNNFLEEHETTQGAVVEYTMKEAHTTTTITRVGNVSVPHTIHHPTQYYITINAKDGEMNYNVKYTIDEKQYQLHNIGDIVNVDNNWNPQSYEVIE